MMRPLRLLLTVATSILALSALLYIVLPSNPPTQSIQRHDRPKGKLHSLLSFHMPSSFFPPSAIISLTDDNSTFFLARPAAFGPLLPSRGLSGQLWIGSGFGGEGLGPGNTITAGEGELGCSDVLGWSDASLKISSYPEKQKAAKKIVKGSEVKMKAELVKAGKTKRTDDGVVKVKDVKDIKVAVAPDADDGTDDYLHRSLTESASPESAKEPGSSKKPEHADIQSLQESAEIAGKVVLLSRGGCGFLEKAKWVQRRGGVAMIVGDNVRGGQLVTMNAREDSSNITIPCVFTTFTTAHLLSSLVPPSKEGLGAAGFKTPQSELTASDDSKYEQKGDPRTFTSSAVVTQPTSTKRVRANTAARNARVSKTQNNEHVGWVRSIFGAFGISAGSSKRQSSTETSRPPSSGSIDWVQVNDWKDADVKGGNNQVSGTGATEKTTKDFVIGVQDWRDPDVISPQDPGTVVAEGSKSKGASDRDSAVEHQIQGGSITPSSGEYEKPGVVATQPDVAVEEEMTRNGANPDDDKAQEGWLVHLPWPGSEDSSSSGGSQRAGYTPPEAPAAIPDDGTDRGKPGFDDKAPHEGLWVTLTPANMSSSPFFDTLLVLVVSPLVTLTVVYALLLLRSRIRRRRWRAPKSVVERLPVRTYHTIASSTQGSSSGSSPAVTPANSSPTTPLLSRSRPRSRTTSEVSHIQPAESPASEHEKREAGLAAWRRKYGGKQRECVVCLEEYVDGVSRVMSLPCGHEFHAECITPWLTTRRRTCPICKTDVVRSMAKPSPSRSPTAVPGVYSNNATPSVERDNPILSDAIQQQAASTRNDSPSAALPVPSSGGSIFADLEQGVVGESSSAPAERVDGFRGLRLEPRGSGRSRLHRRP